MGGEETEIGVRNEEVGPEQVWGEERDIRRESTGVHRWGGRSDGETPESPGVRSGTTGIRAFTIQRENPKEVCGEGEVCEVLGSIKLGESCMDMKFKGVRGEGEVGVESVELVCWGVVGETAETEIDVGDETVDYVDGVVRESGSVGKGFE